MCGLNLLLRGHEFLVHDMNRAIAHRGIRAETLILPHFTLGHVRLPIVGLDGRFDQPYRYEGWTFLFVGEIVNFKELDPEAESDIQVLAKYWINYGPGCVKHFDGFWSFIAIEDRRPHVAHVVLDFLAKKPLYLYHVGTVVAISSEIKAFTTAFPLEPDLTYFSSVRKWGYHPGNRTWARGVTKLPPGSYTRIEEWGLPGNHLVHTEIVDEIVPDPSIDLIAAIVQAVDRRVMASDVPLSILLSGGLDSSIIYQLARDIREDITVYHVENGEREFLDLLQVKGPIREIVFEDSPIKEVLRANEGPVDLGSMLQQYALGQAIREHVCLSGDGADELFGGYRRAVVYDSQYSDTFEELVYYHLPRLDKMMMAGTVELRSPFLARDVVAGALALPREVRTSKQWLRKAFAGALPDRIIEAPKRALKSKKVLEDSISWRNELCDIFLKMIRQGDV